MAYVLYQIARFGVSKAGLATVGYQLYNADATPNGARITAGVQDLGGGTYGASISYPNGFTGRVVWDTGEVTPAYANQEMNPQTAEYAGLIPRILGLSQDNWVMDDTTYDAYGNLLTGNVYVYDTAAHTAAHVYGGGGGTGLLYKYAMTATYTNGKVTGAKQTRTI